VRNEGVVLQPVRAILRIESFLLFAALIAAYWFLRANWVVFLVLLLTPDLAMLGYLSSTRIGATLYNAFHTYAGPIVLAGVSVFFHLFAPLALVWAAHIAMDRALGYGLKYQDSFAHTHLGTIAKNATVRP
jgi:hypothetical protein